MQAQAMQAGKNQALGSLASCQANIAPKEPNLTERVAQLSGHLLDIASLQANIRAKLFGNNATGSGECKDKTAPHELGIQERVTMALEMAANLVGEARTILSKL